jgi:hypothetical protein
LVWRARLLKRRRRPIFSSTAACLATINSQRNDAKKAPRARPFSLCSRDARARRVLLESLSVIAVQVREFVDWVSNMQSSVKNSERPRLWGFLPDLKYSILPD